LLGVQDGASNAGGRAGGDSQIRPDGPILDVPPEAGDFGRLDGQWAMRPTPIVQKFLMGKLGPPVQTEQYFDHDENRGKIEFRNRIDRRSLNSLITV
jgi:hypothetical protein